MGSVLLIHDFVYLYYLYNLSQGFRQQKRRRADRGIVERGGREWRGKKRVRKVESEEKWREEKWRVKKSGSEKRNRINGKAKIEYILRIARGRRFDGKDIEIYIIYIDIYIPRKGTSEERNRIVG